jgi:hypothetical protein
MKQVKESVWFNSKPFLQRDTKYEHNSMQNGLLPEPFHEDILDSLAFLGWSNRNSLIESLRETV